MTHSTTPRNRTKPLVRKIAVFLFWIAVWQAGALYFNQEVLLPSPLSTLKTLFRLLQTAEFYTAVALSLFRILAGYLLGVITGIIGAIISYRCKWFDAIFSPVIQIIRAVPVASFIILAYVWFHSSVLPVAICTLMVLPLIWTAVQSALNQIDAKYLEMAKTYRLKPLKILFSIKIPLVLPSFSAAAVTALGFAWKSGVATEVICRPEASIGGMMRDAQVYIEMPEVFALTAVVCVLSMLLEWLIKYLLGRSHA